jgi:hypothetical protein
MRDPICVAHGDVTALVLASEIGRSVGPTRGAPFVEQVDDRTPRSLGQPGSDHLPAHQRVYVLAAVPNVSGSSFAAYLSKVVTARTKIAEDDSGAPSRPGALVASVAKPTAPRAKDAVALSLEMLEMAWCRGSEPGSRGGRPARTYLPAACLI